MGKRAKIIAEIERQLPGWKSGRAFAFTMPTTRLRSCGSTGCRR